MRLPGGAEGGTRISALTQPLDLPATFAEMPPETHGRNLLPLIRGDVACIRPYAVSAMRVNDHERWLLRTPDYVLHLPIAPTETTPDLFLKPEDRWEVNNLYQQQVELAESMATALRAFKAAIAYGHALAYPPIVAR